MMINQNKELLQRMQDCYNQTGAWLDGSILPKHERESVEGFARRKDMICSPAVYRYLVDTYDVLYARAPVRSIDDGELDEVYQAFTYNCGEGLCLDSLLKRALKVGGIVSGVGFIVMDADREQPDNMGDMLGGRTYPYLELILPQAVTSLIVDRVGRIHKFAYQYTRWEDEAGGSLYEKTYGGGRITERRQIKLEDGATAWEPVGEPVAYPNQLMPVIPVVPSDAPLETSKIPPSPTLGIYQGQKNITVNNSLIDENIYSQQFSVLVINTDKNTEGLKLGASNTLTLAPGDAADFKSPSGSPIDRKSVV